MIIFYNKQTGEIVGTIEGRIHSQEHLGMWVGDKEKNDRLVVNWTHIGEGKFVPDHHQPELFKKLERNPSLVYKHKVVVENGKHSLILSS